MPRGIPRISNSRLKTCKYCKARTSRNRPCRRLSSCKKGCKNFCAQHADSLGGYVKRTKSGRVSRCEEPEIEDCDKDTTSFPCKKKLTYFWTKKSYDEYKSLKKKSRVKNKRSNASIISSYRKRHSKSPPKRTPSRRIRFV